MYLRFELLRGVINKNQYQQEICRLKEYLGNEIEKQHLQAFNQQLSQDL